MVEQGNIFILLAVIALFAFVLTRKKSEIYNSETGAI